MAPSRPVAGARARAACAQSLTFDKISCSSKRQMTLPGLPPAALLEEGDAGVCRLCSSHGAGFIHTLTPASNVQLSGLSGDSRVSLLSLPSLGREFRLALKARGHAEAVDWWSGTRTSAQGRVRAPFPLTWDVPRVVICTFGWGGRGVGRRGGGGGVGRRAAPAGDTLPRNAPAPPSFLNTHHFQIEKLLILDFLPTTAPKSNCIALATPVGWVRTSTDTKERDREWLLSTDRQTKVWSALVCRKS